MAEICEEQDPMAGTSVTEGHHIIDVVEDKIEYLKLEMHRAAWDGDWKKAAAIFKEHPEHITPSTRIGSNEGTALHIATAAGRTVFVEHLVQMMSKEDLMIENIAGETAFISAIVYGLIEAARIMLRKKPDLATNRCGEDAYWRKLLPVQVAALCGHDRMVCFLYEVSKNQLEDSDRVDALLTLIDYGLHDIAKEILSDNLGLPIQANEGEIALCGTTRKFSNTNKLTKQGIELIKEILKQANGHGRSDWIKEALFRASHRGNIEFLTAAIQLYPKLAFETDENGHTIFHVAVLNRCFSIFNILHLMDFSIKDIIKSMKDKEGNNILYLAAKMPKSGLHGVPGAALQLQRELFWFEESKKLFVLQHMKDKLEGYTLLFKEEHEELRKEGEKWLTKTAKSYMYVAVVFFALAIPGLSNVPGGYEQHSGVPIRFGNFWFKTYGISYAITSTFSALSVLFFVSILTSSFSMRDFQKSLPSKLLFGLSTLFVSILAFIAAFIAAFFINFQHQDLQFAYPVVAVAFAPILLVSYLFLPLCFQIFCSTFMPFQFMCN